MNAHSTEARLEFQPVLVLQTPIAPPTTTTTTSQDGVDKEVSQLLVECKLYIGGIQFRLPFNTRSQASTSETPFLHSALHFPCVLRVLRPSPAPARLGLLLPLQHWSCCPRAAACCCCVDAPGAQGASS